MIRSSCSLGHGILIALFLPSLTAAQQGPGGQGIGIVTAIRGQAMVSRASLPQLATLRFRDDVFFRDQITTRERSTVRLLLGGKGVLTIRELSQVILDESVAPEGGRRSVLGLLSGKIGAAVVRGLMQPGESIEIRTPHAVAAVRGTVLIVEYIPPPESAAAPEPAPLASATPGPLFAQGPSAGGTSKFIVLSGQVNVTVAGQPPITLGPLQAVHITATPTGIQTGVIQTLTPAQVTEAAQGLGQLKPHTGEAGGSKAAQAQAQLAAAVATAIVEAVTGQAAPTQEADQQQQTDQAVKDTAAAVSQQQQAPATTLTAPSAPTITVAPVVPQVQSSLVMGSSGEAGGSSGAAPSGGGTSGGATGGGASGGGGTGGGGSSGAATGGGGTTGGGSGGGASSGGGSGGGGSSSAATGGAGTGGGAAGGGASGGGGTGGGGSSAGGSGGGTGNANTLPSGPLLNLNNVTLTLDGGVSFATFGAGTPNAVVPLVSFGTGAKPTDVAVTAPLLEVTGNPITHSGTLLLSGAILLLDGHAGIVGASTDTVTPLFQISGTDMTNAGGAVFELQGGSTLTFFGPVLSLQPGATATLTGVMNVTGGSAAALGPADALVIQSGSSLTSTGTLFSVTGNSTLATSSGGNLVSVHPSSLILTAPILAASGKGVVSLAGPLLSTMSSTVTSNQPLALIEGGSTLATTAGPFVQVNNGSLTADSIVSVQGASSAVHVTGSLLDLTNATATFRALTEISGNASFRHTLGAEEPAIRMTDSGLTLTGPGASLVHIETDSPGLALIATNGSGKTTTISLAGPLLELGSAGFSLTATTPQINLSSMKIQQTGTDPLIKVGAGAVTLQGALLQATDSNLTAAGGLLSVAAGGSVSAPVLTDPLLELIGGDHSIGSGTDSSTGSLLDLRGVNTDKKTTGLGTDEVLKTGGPIVELNGATPATGATVNLSGTGNAIKVDTVLLAASAPIVKLINSTLNTSPTGDANTGAMHLYQSSVTSLGPVFGLDNSTLTVKSGPLLSLTGGSSMTVNGDFASLINGSKITVLNGPLISVDGINAKGTPSTLNVTGALVNFGGTGGNQVIVNNTIAPTSTLSGIPVSQTGRGSSIAIGQNPIKNPTVGSVSVNGVLAGSGPHTGSLIQATNGGKVAITAP